MGKHHLFNEYNIIEALRVEQLNSGFKFGDLPLEMLLGPSWLYPQISCKQKRIVQWLGTHPLSSHIIRPANLACPLRICASRASSVFCLRLFSIQVVHPKNTLIIPESSLAGLARTDHSWFNTRFQVTALESDSNPVGSQVASGIE